jgi:hypothetical protein
MAAPKSNDFLNFDRLHCPDRIVITGTSQDFGWESSMKAYCRLRGIEHDYLAAWAQPLTDRIRELALEAACHSGIDMVDCNKYKGRKDDYVKEIIQTKGFSHGVPIAVFRSMENCRSFYRSQSKYQAQVKGSPFKFRQCKCMHYYIYFMDEVLGLVCLRIQSYAPFGIQYIINGHDILAQLLNANGIVYSKVNNCFPDISDIQAAQKLSDEITGTYINQRLDELSRAHIPLADIMPLWYRFTIRQVEYSTDIYIGNTNSVSEKAHSTVQQLILHRPDDMISYLTDSPRTPRKPESTYRQSHLGICVRFSVGTTSIKVYHKSSALLRIETTSYNLRKITVFRTVTSRSGTKSQKRAPLTRSLYDIGLFVDYARDANTRMTDRLSLLWDKSYPKDGIKKIATKTEGQKINFSGINIFSTRDSILLESIGSAHFDLSGFKRSDIIGISQFLTPSQATYAIRRLRAHSLIKKGKGSNRYHLTKSGRSACIASKTLEALVATPIMAA